MAGVEHNCIFVFLKTYLRGGALVVAADNLVAARLLGVEVRDDGVAVTPSGRGNRVHRLLPPAGAISCDRGVELDRELERACRWLPPRRRSLNGAPSYDSVLCASCGIGPDPQVFRVPAT